MHLKQCIFSGDPRKPLKRVSSTKRKPVRETSTASMPGFTGEHSFDSQPQSPSTHGQADIMLELFMAMSHVQSRGEEKRVKGAPQQPTWILCHVQGRHESFQRPSGKHSQALGN